jgi:hypothetical protein
MIRARARAVLFALSMTTGLSCVLPDLEIVTEDEKITNKQAVRFARSFTLTAEADGACIKDEDDEGCVQPAVDPRNVLPPFLDPRYVEDNVLKYDFCACGDAERDERALPPFTLYVEDRDEDSRTREPKDKIYAALMLDLDPRESQPNERVAYRSYLDPAQPLERVSFDYEPALRSPPHLREMTLGDETQQFDLCNRAFGDSLTEGYHTLQIIVSDRAWFQDTDSNGQKVTQTGVPNIAGGATFDITTYVFHCDIKRAEDDTTVYLEGHCNTQCKGADEEQL